MLMKRDSREFDRPRFEISTADASSIWIGRGVRLGSVINRVLTYMAERNWVS